MDKKVKILLMTFSIVFFTIKSFSQGYRLEIINGDSILFFDMPAVVIKPGIKKLPKFKNKKEVIKYNRLTRYVKKVYPYAQLASQKLKECEEEIKRDPESRKKAMRKVEKALRKRYGSALKKLTVKQGKLLLLLIDRQTGLTTFELVQELRGSFNASMYQGIAVLFGHSLKLNYEPNGKDWMIEDIIRKIEYGII
jgi:hypothetical protein